MNDFFEQVRDAGKVPFYYLALSGALVVPDLCGAMESTDGRATGAKYAAWYDAHLAGNYARPDTGEPTLSGVDCYRLRCSFLHQGRTSHESSLYSRVLFLEPGAITFHMTVNGDALLIDVPTFCHEMATAALKWLPEAEQTAEFKSNFPRFIQRYPGGLSPYVIGAPIYT